MLESYSLITRMNSDASPKAVKADEVVLKNKRKTNISFKKLYYISHNTERRSELYTSSPKDTLFNGIYLVIHPSVQRIYFLFSFLNKY